MLAALPRHQFDLLAPHLTTVSLQQAEVLAERAQHLLAQIAPLRDDAEVQRLRELSMDYIHEAERIEREGATTLESSEQISAGLDAIARYFFARAVRDKSKE